jgi:hypothetical protein
VVREDGSGGGCRRDAVSYVELPVAGALRAAAEVWYVLRGDGTAMDARSHRVLSDGRVDLVVDLWADDGGRPGIRVGLSQTPTTPREPRWPVPETGTLATGLSGRLK